MTRRSDSQGTTEEEVQLDGDRERRDGWRFDRVEVSGEDGGGEVRGAVRTVKAMHG